MRFLLKAAFWLTVVVLLLPGDEKRPTAVQVGAAEAVSAASATVSDMRHFCARQAEACAVGSQAATAFGQKAQAGAKMLYEFLSDRVPPNEIGSVPAKPGDRNLAARVAPPSQNTLTPADLATPWRAPDPRRDGRPPA
jgi:hypothetical protein